MYTCGSVVVDVVFNFYIQVTEHQSEFYKYTYFELFLFYYFTVTPQNINPLVHMWLCRMYEPVSQSLCHLIPGSSMVRASNRRSEGCRCNSCLKA